MYAQEENIRHTAAGSYSQWHSHTGFLCQAHVDLIELYKNNGCCDRETFQWSNGRTSSSTRFSSGESQRGSWSVLPTRGLLQYNWTIGRVRFKCCLWSHTLDEKETSITLYRYMYFIIIHVNWLYDMKSFKMFFFLKVP